MKMHDTELLREAISLLRSACPVTAIMDESLWLRIYPKIEELFMQDRAADDFTAKLHTWLKNSDVDTLRLVDITRSGREMHNFVNTYRFSRYRWLMDVNSPDIIDAYPASELIVLSMDEPIEPWVAKWEASGGSLVEGRMVAHKTDLIWERVSAYGIPHPPWLFGSTADIEDVCSDEATRLGVDESRLMRTEVKPKD